MNSSSYADIIHTTIVTINTKFYFIMYAFSYCFSAQAFLMVHLKMP